MSSAENVTVKLCDLASLASGEITTTQVDGREIAYARIGDDWYAIDDTCTHQAVSLAEGYLEEDDITIECPLHGALFSLETGDALTLPATKAVARHEVEVRGDEVYVTIQGDDE